MDIPAGLVTSKLLILSWLLFAVIAFHALRSAPWARIFERDSANVYFGCIVLLLIFWHLTAGVYPGLSFHFLGATLACLMFGWQFAFIAIQILILLTTFNGHGGWSSFAINGLLLGSIPVLTTHFLLTFAQQKLPHNFFIYIFINGFFAALLGILLAGLTAYAVLLHSEAYTATQLQQNYLPFLLLLALPEGTLNGIGITLMVVYFPSWVASFSDEMYLYKREDNDQSPN
jgi:uncharacterized membrane protein